MDEWIGRRRGRGSEGSRGSQTRGDRWECDDSVDRAASALAGIDVPAAGLFQHQAKAEGQGLGIEYVTLAEVLGAVQ